VALLTLTSTDHAIDFKPAAGRRPAGKLHVPQCLGGTSCQTGRMLRRFHETARGRRPAIRPSIGSRARSAAVPHAPSLLCHRPKGGLQAGGMRRIAFLQGQNCFCLERLAQMAPAPISSLSLAGALGCPVTERDERMIRFASLEPRAGVQAKHVCPSKWCSRNGRM
jgi:hypothetical protein